MDISVSKKDLRVDVIHDFLASYHPNHPTDSLTDQSDMKTNEDPPFSLMGAFSKYDPRIWPKATRSKSFSSPSSYDEEYDDAWSLSSLRSADTIDMHQAGLTSGLQPPTPLYDFEAPPPKLSLHAALDPDEILSRYKLPPLEPPSPRPFVRRVRIKPKDHAVARPIPSPPTPPRPGDRRVIQQYSSRALRGSEATRQQPAIEQSMESSASRSTRRSTDSPIGSSAGSQQQLSLKKGHYTSGTTDFVVVGSVNGVRTEASPDTGSDECIISPHFASKLGQRPAAGTEKVITLANNKTVQSPGMVKVLWKFANDSTSHSLKCWILPGSSKDFVLGSRFLRATRTLTTFIHRVKKVLLPSKLRLRLLGEEKQRTLGIFNNRITTALADTGSDLMLVSSDYVRRHGIVMSTERQHLTEVELADSTRTWTCGIVKDAMWTIGDETVRCDFHVLDGLSADIILSKDYLFDMNVFANHTESFFDIDSVEGLSLLCGVRLIEEGLYNLEELENEFLRDVTSQTAFNLEAAKKERVRRSLTMKKIAALPFAERPEALRREEDKKQRWNKARVHHKRLWTRSS